jgi:hypothetical protein
MVYDNIIWPFLKMEDMTTTRGQGSTVVIPPDISGNFIQALSSENANKTKCTLHFRGQYLIQSIQSYVRNSKKPEFYSNLIDWIH